MWSQNKGAGAPLPKSSFRLKSPILPGKSFHSSWEIVPKFQNSLLSFKESTLLAIAISIHLLWEELRAWPHSKHFISIPTLLKGFPTLQLPQREHEYTISFFCSIHTSFFGCRGRPAGESHIGNQIGILSDISIFFFFYLFFYFHSDDESKQPKISS